MAEPRSQRRGPFNLTALREAVEPHSVSIALHGAVAVALVLAVPLAHDELQDLVEIELVEAPEPVERPEPPEPVAPEEEPIVPTGPVPPAPTPERPPQPPKDARVQKVDRPRVYTPNARALDALRDTPAPPDAVPSFDLPEPSPAFALDLDAVVNGVSDIEVITSRGGSNTLARPGVEGTPGHKGPPPTPTRPPDVEVTDTWEVSRDPVPLNDRAFAPLYPPEARARRAESSVILRLTIDAEGRVNRAEVARSGGAAFDASAVAYGRRLRFTPAEANGKPVATAIEWEVAYRIHNE